MCAGPGQFETAVGRGVLFTPRGHINEAVSGWLGVHHVVVCEREETEIPRADSYIGACGGGDHAETHYGQAPPTIRGRKETPVVEHVATQGVSHVV